MDKKEAISRLDSLEHEAAELRKIIERPEELVYDGRNVYIAIILGKPYILAGHNGEKYFRWHSFTTGNYDFGTEQAWSSNHKTGQGALDYVTDNDIHVFSDGKAGIQFFYDQYMKAHK